MRYRQARSKQIVRTFFFENLTQSGKFLFSVFAGKLYGQRSAFQRVPVFLPDGFFGRLTNQREMKMFLGKNSGVILASLPEINSELMPTQSLAIKCAANQSADSAA